MGRDKKFSKLVVGTCSSLGWQKGCWRGIFFLFLLGGEGFLPYLICVCFTLLSLVYVLDVPDGYPFSSLYVHHVLISDLFACLITLLHKSGVFMETTALLLAVEIRSAYISPSPYPTFELDLLGPFGLVWSGLVSFGSVGLD